MDREEINWLLGQEPPPAMLQPFRKQKGRRERERADAAMWEAIDHNDSRALARALDGGARAKSLRNGTPPVWYCAQSVRHGLIRQLVEAGADPSALARGASIWAAIAPRDDPDEAEALAGLLGGTPRLDIFELANRGAWRMMVWGAEKLGRMRGSWGDVKSDGMGDENLAWINAVVHGPEGVIECLTHEWGCGPGKPVEEVTGSGFVRGAWEQVAISDNIEKAKRLLKHGWLPPQTSSQAKLSSYQRAVSVLWRHGMGWVFLEKGAWNLWTWWMSSPMRKQQFEQALICSPNQTLWEIARNKASLERIVALGIDMDVRDERGNTLAHGLFSSTHLTRTMVQWWIDHRPGDLSVTNHEGLTPLEVKAEKEPVVAWARARVMGAKTTKTQRGPGTPNRL